MLATNRYCVTINDSRVPSTESYVGGVYFLSPIKHCTVPRLHLRFHDFHDGFWKGLLNLFKGSLQSTEETSFQT